MTRKEILEKLASGEITRADAEQQLVALGSPVPHELPLPPAGGQKGMSRGCLIVLLIGIVIVGLMLTALPLLFLGKARTDFGATPHLQRLNRPMPSHSIHYEVERAVSESLPAEDPGESAR
ncbi:MAG: hypothetical protein ACI9TH_001401 [Kiritimatiellia bacterium]|jgi:hypothetical protein